jgi:hypothetical protein
VCHKAEIFLAALLHFEGPLGAVGLQGEADCAIEYPVDNVKRLALQVDAIGSSEVMDPGAQNIVFRNDLLNVEVVPQAL